MQRHSNLGGFNMPEAGEAVFMRATCKYVSVLDFSQGIGHREQLVLDDEGVPIEVDLSHDEWGSGVSPNSEG